MTNPYTTFDNSSYDSAARIKWMFTTEKARHKLSRAYPKPHLPIEDQPKES